ncbi:DNA-binding transcriptional regulator YhcF, GntR family [Mucilaginibacter gossypiicola]|uniref:DNA-binding transcriptional regulator YhcF, GntR family n=1 Tax=Mucilaginibacter gossypiicola TaxID=551995 RepID=A0A1H8DPN3_9SPHI|nr:GntR family transcriptional regulator [Mucilaginibacter gossypiicola]SEN09200.1 DNA-binding transcriptional regulator YhcF, GntR family [Mucilaginibacter gossypiicola]
MDFKENEPIYLQIAGSVSENILTGKWPPGEKITSIRDLAIELEVNPNTVNRAYELLQNQEVIINKRGMGLFVAADGAAKIKTIRKERFMQQELPEFFRNILLLDIELNDLQSVYQLYKKENKTNKETGHENEQ